MANRRAALRAEPLEWLLEPGDPAVRHPALRQLPDRPAADPDVAKSRRAAMAASPIASILAAQAPDGHWEKPGPGYATKYRGTVWQLIFLDQLGADPGDERVRRACEYVLAHSQAENGGFGASGVAGAGPPPSSGVIHCLTGNLLRALIGFGWLDDPRVVRAIEWQASAWFKLGFPSGNVADVPQNLEVLAELGHARMPVSETRSNGCWRSRTRTAGGPTSAPAPARPG